MAEKRRLRVYVNRAGTPSEISSFLLDFDRSYSALYAFRPRTRRRYLGRLAPWDDLPAIWLNQIDGQAVPPNDWLEITAISVASPGFFEMLGAWNPLQQIREYLKDRHERTKDHYWRTATERERAELENDFLRTQIQSATMAELRETAELLREFGAGPEEVQQFLWSRLGRPLAALGRHQDTGLLSDQNEPDQ